MYNFSVGSLDLKIFQYKNIKTIKYYQNSESKLGRYVQIFRQFF